MNTPGWENAINRLTHLQLSACRLRKIAQLTLEFDQERNSLEKNNFLPRRLFHHIRHLVRLEINPARTQTAALNNLLPF